MSDNSVEVQQSDGMTLLEHFSELRKRLVRSAIALLVCTVAVWREFETIFSLIRAPYDSVQGIGSDAILALTGVTSGFSLQLKVSLAAAVVVTALTSVGRGASGRDLSLDCHYLLDDQFFSHV